MSLRTDFHVRGDDRLTVCASPLTEAVCFGFERGEFASADRATVNLYVPAAMARDLAERLLAAAAEVEEEAEVRAALKARRAEAA